MWVVESPCKLEWLRHEFPLALFEQFCRTGDVSRATEDLCQLKYQVISSKNAGAAYMASDKVFRYMEEALFDGHAGWNPTLAEQFGGSVHLVRAAKHGRSV